MPNTRRTKNKKPPTSLGGKTAKRCKQPKKANTKKVNSRPSRGLSPTLSEAELRAKEAMVMLDEKQIQEYFKANDLSPPQGSSFKTDWAALYATECAARRLSNRPSLPPLPSRQDPLSGGKKGKRRQGRKRQRETETPLKDKKLTAGTPRKDANLQPGKVAALPKAVRESLLIELLQLQEQEHENAQDDGVGLGSPPSSPEKKGAGDYASEDHVDGGPRSVLLDAESGSDDATSDSEEDPPPSPNQGDDEMRQLLRQTLSELLKFSASSRRELVTPPPPSALPGARPAAQSAALLTTSTNPGNRAATAPSVLRPPHTPSGIGNGGTALQGGGTALGTSHGTPPPD
jgi:hypothetical protein